MVLIILLVVFVTRSSLCSYSLFKTVSHRDFNQIEWFKKKLFSKNSEKFRLSTISLHLANINHSSPNSLRSSSKWEVAIRAIS